MQNIFFFLLTAINFCFLFSSFRCYSRPLVTPSLHTIQGVVSGICDSEIDFPPVVVSRMNFHYYVRADPFFFFFHKNRSNIHIIQYITYTAHKATIHIDTYRWQVGSISPFAVRFFGTLFLFFLEFYYSITIDDLLNNELIFFIWMSIDHWIDHSDCLFNISFLSSHRPKSA